MALTLGRAATRFGLATQTSSSVAARLASSCGFRFDGHHGRHHSRKDARASRVEDRAFADRKRPAGLNHLSDRDQPIGLRGFRK